jgi:hypothetical protein
MVLIYLLILLQLYRSFGSGGSIEFSLRRVGKVVTWIGEASDWREQAFQEPRQWALKVSALPVKAGSLGKEYLTTS